MEKHNYTNMDFNTACDLMRAGRAVRRKNSPIVLVVNDRYIHVLPIKTMSAIDLDHWTDRLAKDWETTEVPEDCGVSTKEIIDALCSGYFVRRKKWIPGAYLLRSGVSVLDHRGFKASISSKSVFANDWEVVLSLPPAKKVEQVLPLLDVKNSGLDFSDALRLLRSGKRMRRAEWAPGIHVQLSKEGCSFIFTQHRGVEDQKWCPGFPTLFASDWEVVPD